MVAISALPHAAGEGTPRVSVVASAVLFEELFGVDNGLEHLVRAERVVLVFEQCWRDDHLVEHTFDIAVIVCSLSVFVHLPHRVEEVAIFLWL